MPPDSHQDMDGVDRGDALGDAARAWADGVRAATVEAPLRDGEAEPSPLQRVMGALAFLRFGVDPTPDASLKEAAYQQARLWVLAAEAERDDLRAKLTIADRLDPKDSEGGDR